LPSLRCQAGDLAIIYFSSLLEELF
jgi:hypothetical protein